MKSHPAEKKIIHQFLEMNNLLFYLFYQCRKWTQIQNKIIDKRHKIQKIPVRKKMTTMVSF